MDQGEFPDWNRPLVPPSVDVDRLPDPLRDGDRPLTLIEARERYLQVERDAWRKNGQTSKHMRHLKNQYPRILEADRQFQGQYEGLTTAKLTRGISPDDPEEVTPWELDMMLNGGSVRSQVRNSLDYHLGDKGGFDFEWVAVTSVTRITGTPREYIYLWIEDPENKVSTGHLAPALETHLESCEIASREDHVYDEEGTGGAITVEHSPPLVSDPPEKFFDIREVSEAPGRPNTRGAQFVATRLVHLPVGDYDNSQRENPPDTLLEGGAIAWATPNRWFRASEGVP
jgi:hypothetical protein